MRIIVYGAGGIGSIVGGFLKLAGQDAILIGRSGHVNAINENGLHLISPTGTHVVRIPAVTAPDRVEFLAGDVVFLCVKSQDTELALDDLHTINKDVPIFCFQNGVRNEETAARYFKHIYGVMVNIGAVYLNDGEVTARRDPPGRLVIGRYPSGIDSIAESAARELRGAGFHVMVTADVMPYKWGKLVANLGNAVGAITNAKPQDVAFIYRAAREELRDILAKANIRWVSSEALDKEWPDSAAETARAITTQAQSSTWQSLARFQGSVETEFLNGEVVRLAEKLGLQAPINGQLLRISKDMAAKHEKPGKYTGEQLGQLLGLKHS